jgi:hypothetical protein
MDIKTTRKPYVFDRRGRKSAHNKPVCIFWRNGKCLKNPCRFLHSELPVICAKKGSKTESSNQQDLPTKNSNCITTKNKLVLKRSLETTVENSREDAGSKHCKKGTSKNLTLKNEESSSNKSVCIFWRNGKCLKNPCRFLHSELPVICAKKGSNTESSNQRDLPTKNSNYIRTKNNLVLKRSLETTIENSQEDVGSKDCKRRTSKDLALKNEESGSNSIEDVLKQNVCQSWVHGNCIDGDKCQSLHSWFHADGLSILAQLQGHTKVALC